MEKLHHLNNLHLQDHFVISTFSSQLFILFYSSGQSCPNLITTKLLKILIPPLYLIICFTYSVLMYLLLLHALYFLFLLLSSASIHPSRFNAPLFLFCSSISRFYASSLFLSPADTSLHPFCPPPAPRVGLLPLRCLSFAFISRPPPSLASPLLFVRASLRLCNRFPSPSCSSFPLKHDPRGLTYISDRSLCWGTNWQPISGDVNERLAVEDRTSKYLFRG